MKHFIYSHCARVACIMKKKCFFEIILEKIVIEQAIFARFFFIIKMLNSLYPERGQSESPAIVKPLQGTPDELAYINTRPVFC